jgi:carboxylesterase type B
MEHFPANSKNEAYQSARKILGHGMFMTVMKPYADALHAMGANVYGYYFDYVPESKGADFGAAHADEIKYAFNTLPQDATAEQGQVAAEMHARWANFIKYNDPNGGDTPSGLAWEQYSPADFKFMNFREQPTFETHPLKADVEFMENIIFGPESTHFD